MSATGCVGGRPAADDGVGEAGNATHAFDVVDADEVCAVGDGEGDGGGGAFEALVDGEIEDGADGALAGGADEDRLADGGEFSEAAEDLKTLGVAPAKAEAGVNDDAAAGEPAASAARSAPAQPSQMSWTTSSFGPWWW